MEAPDAPDWGAEGAGAVVDGTREEFDFVVTALEDAVPLFSIAVGRAAGGGAGTVRDLPPACGAFTVTNGARRVVAPASTSFVPSPLVVVARARVEGS